MAQPWYVSREMVKAALDIKETARSDAQVDRAIDAASRNVEGLCHRIFYPWTGTHRFDWPSPNRSRSWRLWLDGHELISLTSLVAGGVTIDPADVLLYPTGGPPYTRVEVSLDSPSAFSSGDSHQQAIAITGTWGYTADEEHIGTLTDDLDADPTDTASVTWIVTDLGVGDILRIDDERLIVTGRSMVDSGQDLAAGLTASAADVDVTVTDGSAFAPGSVLLVGGERMLVVDVAGDTLIVKRAWDGSVLAAHSSGADVYHLAGMSVDRAQLGTSLASHASGAVVYRHVVPGLVRDAVVALALRQMGLERAEYGRSAGAGETQRQIRGRTVDEVLDDLYRAYGRKARIRGV